MKNKSDVSFIFPVFKSLVEKQLQSHIKTLYSDNGGEYIKLRSFLQQHGISHLTTPPYTPEHNGLFERKHRHLVETARCLLHHASLPPQFWCYSLQTAAFLINRLPTPSLKMQTPLNKLFNQTPNYDRLKTFGCLCFPLLAPYTHNKLAPKSQPCVFLGYSNTQSAYLCFNSVTQKLYTSRHVQFVETVFPYSTLNSQNTNTILNSNLMPTVPPQTNIPLNLQLFTHSTPPISQSVVAHSISQPPSNSNSHTNSPPPLTSFKFNFNHRFRLILIYTTRTA